MGSVLQLGKPHNINQPGDEVIREEVIREEGIREEVIREEGVSEEGIREEKTRATGSNCREGTSPVGWGVYED